MKDRGKILTGSKRKKGKDENVINCVCLCVIVILALIVKVDGISLWSMFRRCIPGAAAIRAVGRFVGFLILPIAVVICWAIQGFSDSAATGTVFKKKYSMKLALVILFGMILFDSMGDFPLEWDAVEYKQKMDHIAAPPSDCKVMFIYEKKTDEETPPARLARLQMDAWQIAWQYHIKTLNGYSGNFPKGWELLRVSEEEYISRVEKWVELNDIEKEGLYGYDIQNNKWLPFSSFTGVE